jgi:hypothetical protein
MIMYKKIYFRIIGILNTTLQFIRFKLIYDRVENARRLGFLRNKLSGKRCFIMGNGPSLLLCDLTLLKGETTIVSNANFLIWDKIGFKPTFLTVEDYLVAEDRAKELNSLSNITKVFPEDLMYCLKQDTETIFINFNRKYNEFPKFSNNFEKEVFWGGTVSYLNIQLAYFLGFKEIYLIGFDHSYNVPKTSKIVNSVIKSDENDNNHIHPDYFGKGFRWHDPRVDRMEEAYIKAKEFLDKSNIKIFNATVGGKLEVFERVDYNKIFTK